MLSLNALAQRCAAHLGGKGGRRLLVPRWPAARSALTGRTFAALAPSRRGTFPVTGSSRTFPRWVSSATEGEVAAPVELEVVVSDPLRQGLVDKWPKFLADLQAGGHFNMPESEEAPEKLEERAEIKKNCLEFARARSDILFSLSADSIRPLTKFTAFEPNKKLNAALRRLDAQFVQGVPLTVGDGGEANFQDVLRVVMEMSYAPAGHLAGISDEAVQAAVDILPELLKVANAGVDEAAKAKADAATAIRTEGLGRRREREERKQNAQPGDWECPSCGGINFSRRTDCFRCEAEKPEGLAPVGLGREDMRRGDWMCSECGTHNFSNKTQCRTCEVPRAQGDPNFGASASQLKPGEWLCPTCGINNFFYRTDCYRCKEERPEGYEAPPAAMRQARNVKPGDWECPECQAHNFSRNQECFKCDAPRPEGAEMTPSAGGLPPRNMRPGDWMCPDCNSHNFARNRECFSCAAPRPADSRPQLSFRGGRDRPAPEMRPGDWMCPECDAHNFGSKVACFRCECARPASAGPPVERSPRGGARQESARGGVDARFGDWDCPECGFHNFARNSECKRCNTAAPGPGDRSSNPPPANIDDLWNVN